MITFISGTEELQAIIILAAFFSVFLAGMYFLAVRHKGSGAFAPLMPITYMFIASITLILFFPLKEVGTDIWLNRTGLYIFRIVIIAAVYYAVLMLAHGSLRKWFRPAVSAVLWQVPGILYLSGILRRGRRFGGLFLFILPPGIVKICTWIWLAGFIAAVLYKAVQHISFKRRLLKGCTEPDGRTEAVNQKACESCSVRGNYHLITYCIAADSRRTDAGEHIYTSA